MGSVVGGLLGGGGGGSAPTRPNIKRSIRDYVAGYEESLPDLIRAEGNFRPQFMDLNLADVSQFLGGPDSGIIGLGRTAQQAAQSSISDARQQDLQDMLGSAGTFRSFAQALSPEAQAQVDAAQAEAARASQAALGLSPQERRQAEQMARESYGARGMLDSNASIAGELLNRENILAGKRQEANQARSNAFGMAQDFYTRPGLMQLNRAPASYQAGQQTLGMGLGAIGSATPQMLNPDAAVNMEMQHQANVANYNAAQAGANAQMGAGLLGGLGSLAGGIFGF